MCARVCRLARRATIKSAHTAWVWGGRWIAIVRSCALGHDSIVYVRVRRLLFGIAERRAKLPPGFPKTP